MIKEMKRKYKPARQDNSSAAAPDGRTSLQIDVHLHKKFF